MKLRFRVYDYEGYMGGVCLDGTIDLHPRLRSSPMVLVSVLLHELIHWILDAIGLYNIKLHNWHDLLYTYIGLYDYNVNRAGVRKAIRSDEWDRLAHENRARQADFKTPPTHDGRGAFSPRPERIPQKRTFEDL